MKFQGTKCKILGVSAIIFLVTLLVKMERAETSFHNQQQQRLVPLSRVVSAVGSVFKKQCSLHSYNITKFGAQHNCSRALFKQYYRECEYFPSGGKWQTVFYNGENISRFQPDACHFQWPNKSMEALQQSFTHLHGASLLFMGSSQMRMYTGGIVYTLGKIDFKCTLVKKENQQDDLIPDPAYFAGNDTRLREMLQPRPHHCRRCLSALYRCTGLGGNLNLEYLGMDDIVDSTLRLHDRGRRENSIETYQEYIFKSYLKGRYPDVLIISPTLNHLKFKDSPEKFAADLDYIRTLMRLYIPEPTEIFWIPRTAESEAHKQTKTKGFS